MTPDPTPRDASGTAATGTGSSTGARSADPRRLLAVAVGGWLVLEAGLRWGAIAGARRLLGHAFVGNAASLLLAMPAIAAAIGWYAARSGRPPDSWGYDWNRRALLAGFLAGPVVLALSAAAAQIDALLFDVDEVTAAVATGVGATVEAYPAIAVVFLLGNAVVVPIAEELVWRGIVQTEAVERWGAPVGIATTAIPFALKHVVVDRSVARLTTLVVLAVAFGLVRHRWGTGASTATHVVVNLVASAGLLAVAL